MNKKIGIIDIGSNSIRMVLFSLSRKGYPILLDEFKGSVRLGDLQDDYLKDSKIKQAIECLTHFKNICNFSKVDKIIAVATAAVRNSKNGKEFQDLILKNIDIKVKIISGEREAYFAYLGVCKSMNYDEGLIVDIGGGSTELIHFKNNSILNSISLDFGSINLKNSFEIESVISNTELIKLKNYINLKLNIANWLKNLSNIPIIAVGGSARSISKIDRNIKNYPLNITHDYSMHLSDLEFIVSILKSKTIEEKKSIKGLSKDRADIFFGPCFTFLTIMNYINSKKLIISGNGIRDGILYDEIQNNYREIKNVLDFSLKSTMYRFNVDCSHAKKVYKFTKSLFKQLSPLLNLSKSNLKILKTASYLHDCGIKISYYNHEDHSFYMILNSRLKGLSQKELLLSAFIASLHRNKKFKLSFETFGCLISKEDIDIITKLSLLLRISESLDLFMDNLIDNINCNISSDSVEIEIISNHNSILEKNRVLEHSDLFKKILNKKLFIKN